MVEELTNHLWQSTLFAFAAGLLTLAFRKNRARPYVIGFGSAHRSSSLFRSGY
jgi:hypothetical protein